MNTAKKYEDSDVLARAKLLGSLRKFTTVFYKLRTGRDFVISDPTSRESHYITIFRELVKVLRLETKRLVINVPPGHGKSTILQHFVAWAMAHYPDSQFLYIAYSKSLAEKHTATIKQIMSMSHYQKIFGVELAQDSTAKGHFRTTAGGAIMAFGSSGSITGQDAGLPNLDRFSGCVIIDDAHKPDEVHSDVMREAVINNYKETIKPRPRGANVPIVAIGQRLHESDLFAYLLSGEDGYKWHNVILKAIDDAGNALCPNINSLEMLRIEQDKNPYVYSAQYQQDPQPSGGGIFKPEWFPVHEFEPDIKATFLTIDTAETDKSYNDATVFSFWGLYQISHDDVQTDMWGLHWIDCVELRVEPKDLKQEFMSFYAGCMRHRIKPKLVAIENKSMGTLLLSTLKEYQGLQLKSIERTKASGSKTTRYLEIQPYIANKLISLPFGAKHTKNCIEHMRKITANNSHAHDDIADTVYDAVKLALIDKLVTSSIVQTVDHDRLAKNVMSQQRRIAQARAQRDYIH